MTVCGRCGVTGAPVTVFVGEDGRTAAESLTDLTMEDWNAWGRLMRGNNVTHTTVQVRGLCYICMYVMSQVSMEMPSAQTTCRFTIISHLQKSCDTGYLQGHYTIYTLCINNGNKCIVFIRFIYTFKLCQAKKQVLNLCKRHRIWNRQP